MGAMYKPPPPSRVDPAHLPEILKVEDVAVVLGISTVHARRKMAAGHIPARRLGKRWYTTRNDLLRALSAPRPSVA
jgi:hypothetical protein